MRQHKEVSELQDGEIIMGGQTSCAAKRISKRWRIREEAPFRETARKVKDEIPRYRGNGMKILAGGFEGARCRKEKRQA